MSHLPPGPLFLRRRSQDSRKSEISHFDPIITGNQQILAFDISMNALTYELWVQETKYEGRTSRAWR
jgi:hypothetical protein